MTFFERRFAGASVLATFSAEVVIVVLLVVAPGAGAHPNVPPGGSVSFAGPLALGGFIAAVVASVLSSAFCRANVLHDLLFTRPGSRVRDAAAIVGIDLAATAVVWIGSALLLGVVRLALAPGMGLGSLTYDDTTARTALGVAASLLAIYGFGIGISFGLKVSVGSLSPAGWAVFAASLIVSFAGAVPLIVTGRSVLKAVGRHADAASASISVPDLHPFFVPDPTLGTLLAFAVGIAGIAAATAGWQRVRF